tara:strand:- start:22975 stop:23784 length:810 start_codon:yes stop_codon:yes gene_type:complete
MKIWKNTSTIDDYCLGLEFTNLKEEAAIALIGSKPIHLDEFPILKGIFKTGIGRDNIPFEKAKEKGIQVCFPSTETIEIILEETASFTCSLIFKMLYNNTGSIEKWVKSSRKKLSNKKLLVIGNGNIGSRVFNFMSPFMEVYSYDILHNTDLELKKFIEACDCITLHIPKIDDNISFFDKEKLSWMKNNSVLINTARGPIVEEKALYNELKNKRIIAAFDVFWQEPYKGILKELHPNPFYMTPHIASTCVDFLIGCRKDLDRFTNELSS